MKRHKRWTGSVTEEDIAPRGKADALKRAKELLAPFAIRHTPRPCDCEKCAEESIVNIAREFNRIRFLMRGAPRAQQVPLKFANVARKSRQLASALKELDDYSRGWLQKTRKPQEGEPDLRPLHRKAKAKELPSSSKLSSGDGLFVERLMNLSEYADELSSFFDWWRLWNFPQDVGGSTNIVTQTLGTPNEALVHRAYIVFMMHGRRVRKTENGAFHQFVNEIRHFATGSRKGEASTFAFIKKKFGSDGRWKRPSMEDLKKMHYEWLKGTNPVK